MEKFVKYFEAACYDKDGNCILESFVCKNEEDYDTHLRDLSRLYKKFEIIYRDYSDGTIEDGYADD